MSRKFFLIFAAVSFVFAATAATAGDVKFADKKEDIVSELSRPAKKAPATKGLIIGGSKDIKIRPEGAAAEQEAEKPRVAAMINFKYNSTEILAKSVPVLDEFGKALNDEKLLKFNFCVEGHTDGDGAAEYNMELSNKRAQAVIEYLAKKWDISRERLSARGWGKSRPIDTNETEEGKQRNRRVEFIRLN